MTTLIVQFSAQSSRASVSRPGLLSTAERSAIELPRFTLPPGTIGIAATSGD
jgi:hypothetical protein